MSQILNITVPLAWQQLSDSQLRYVFKLLSGNYSLPQVKTLCLLKWADIKVIRRMGIAFIIEYKEKQYTVATRQITEALSSLSWIEGFSQYPVRLSRIGSHKAKRADFQDVSFGDYLILDNLYQGYLQTKREQLLDEMASILYQCDIIHLSASEQVNVFYWFASIKQYFANMWRSFYKAVSTDGSPHIPTREQLQESMDTQIRALTGGDITKERQVLEMDCWRALTELNAKAKDYEEMKRLNPSFQK